MPNLLPTLPTLPSQPRIPRGRPGRRGGTTALRLLAPALLVALAAAALPATAAAAGPVAAVPTGACTDDTGVTVVVDLTDLGGEVEVACATDAATGTEALQAVGFVDTRDGAGMICAIDGLPDPCPATFEGSYWSYWYATPDGEWQPYMEGSDTAVPQPGNLEGWRYSDGTAGPTVTPAVALATAPDPAEDGETTTSGEDDTAGDDADGAADGTELTATDTEPATDEGPSPVLLAGVGLVAVLAVAALLLARRRNGAGPHGPAGQD